MLINKLEVIKIKKPNFSKNLNIALRRPTGDLHIRSLRILKNGDGIHPQ
jgi:hypothetical protein